MEDVAPVSPSDDTPEPVGRPTKSPTVFLAALLALIAVVAACSLLGPRHSTSDYGIGDLDLGCFTRHGGCPDSASPTTYADESGVDVVGVWPLIILFGLARLATSTAIIATRAMQALTGTCAIGISLLLAPYVVFVSRMARVLAANESLGGEGTFYIMLFLTFLTGIANVVAPRRPRRPQTVDVPRARARIHVSGMRVPARGKAR